MQRLTLQLGEVLNLWAPSAPASPPCRKELQLQARLRGGRGSREPSQAAKGTLPPGPPSCWVRASAAAPLQTPRVAQHRSCYQPANSSKCEVLMIFMLLRTAPVPLASHPVHKGSGSTGAPEGGKAARGGDRSTSTSSWYWLNWCLKSPGEISLLLLI